MPEVGSLTDVTHWQGPTSDDAGKLEHLTTFFGTTNRCMLNKMDNNTDNKAGSNMDCFRWLWQAKRLATVDTLKFVRRKVSQTRLGPVEVAFTSMFLVFMRERERERQKDRQTNREKMQSKGSNSQSLSWTWGCRSCCPAELAGASFPADGSAGTPLTGSVNESVRRDAVNNSFSQRNNDVVATVFQLQALATHCLKRWNNPGTRNTAGSEMMVLSFHQWIKLHSDV